MELMKNYIARNNTDAVVQEWDGDIIGPENTDKWADYQAWLAEGNTPVPAAPDLMLVPSFVTPLQFRKALNQLNLRNQIEEYVQTLDQESKDAWEYAIAIERNSPIVVGAANSLNKTSEEVDNLFRLAFTL
jgi:hypothetical protein